ncbi:hypothetical protein OHB49_35580 [Streptomyces sp. NBC_01717]|nr:hypothetical protein [Streptomyces sp. NBC_01717]
MAPTTSSGRPVWSVVMIAMSGFIIRALSVVQRGNIHDLSEERPTHKA